MGRKRGRGRSGKRSGGALTSLRGGFKSTVRGATGGERGSPTRTRRLLSNLLTVALLVAAALLLARRFGVFR
jgi:hypothetical protein